MLNNYTKNIHTPELLIYNHIFIKKNKFYFSKLEIEYNIDYVLLKDYLIQEQKVNLMSKEYIINEKDKLIPYFEIYEKEDVVYFLNFPENNNGVFKNECTVDIYYLDDKIPNDAIENIKKFRVKKKKEINNISIISRDEGGLFLDNSIKIKNNKSLDVSKYYNDDFLPIHKNILTHINKKKSGIFIFNGETGTGKTNYIRHLVTKVKDKRVVFVPPYLLETVSDPSFIGFLISELSNTVIVIEEAESLVVTDNYKNRSSGVSNILNISDGLLSDYLNIQFILTFNTERDGIDRALLREGRLIAEYQFNRITPEKATIISKEIGKNIIYKEPVTLSTVFGDKISNVDANVKKIGF